MKKIISTILMLAMILSMSVVLTTVTSAADAWDGKSVAEGYASGTGIDGDPYIIETAAQLKYFADQINAGAYVTDTNGDGTITKNDFATPIHVKLNADIDLGDNVWGVIGTASPNVFSGVFDGGNHTISNFRIESTNTNTGFFGVIESSTIKDLTIAKASISGNGDSAHTAAIVGVLASKTTVATLENLQTAEDVTVSSKSTSKCPRAGGILGGMQSAGAEVTIKNCVNRASVTAEITVAKHDTSVGGIAGTIRAGVIENCVNYGNVKGNFLENSRSGVAGILGSVIFKNTVTVKNVVNYGNVEGAYGAAGILGYIHSGTDINIENAYSLAESVTAKTKGLLTAARYESATPGTCTLKNSVALAIEGLTTSVEGITTETNVTTAATKAEIEALPEVEAILVALGLKEVKPADPEANSTLTIEQAIALGQTKEHNNYTEGKYYVTGKITEIYNTQYGNMKITDENGNILTIYGTYSADGSTRFDAMETKPAVGDTVTVYGIVGQYNGTPQIKNGWITSIVPAEKPDEPEKPADPEANTTLTIEQAIALGQTKEHNNYTEGKYYVTGKITEIYNTQYGNMKITDENGNILTIYGTYSADGSTRFDAMETKPAVGDTVTIYGIIGQYSGTPQIKNGWITSIVPAETPDEPDVPVEPDKPTLPDKFEIENEVNANVGIGDFATNNGWEDKKQYTEIKLDEYITVTAAGGQNTGKFYTNGNNWRIYQSENGTITISAAEGKVIASVKITYVSEKGGVLLAGETEIESNELTDVNDITLTLSVGNTGTATNGQARIESITVVYGDLVIPEPINPETGDNTLAYVIALAAVIVIASAAVVVIRKKENA